MTFQNQSAARDRKFRDESQVIDASIVALTLDTPLIDDRWVIVLDPNAIDPDDFAIRLTVADLVDEDDDDQDGEAE